MGSGERPIDWRLGAACATVAALVYLTGFEPDVHWGDSADFATSASHLGLTVKARGYPLMQAVCWAGGQLLGSPALAANLFSLVSSALAVGVLALVVRELGGTRFAAASAAGILGLSHTFWSYATVAEVYGMHDLIVLVAFLGAARMRAARPYGAALLGCALGVSLLHHRLILFTAPILVLWAVLGAGRGPAIARLRRLTLWTLFAAIPFLLLCVVGVMAVVNDGRHGGSVVLWAKAAGWGGDMQMDFVAGARNRSTIGNALYLAKWVTFNVPLVGLALAALGIAARSSWRSGIALPLVALLAANSFFPFRYDWTGDQYAFLTPLYPVLAIAAGLGLDAPPLAARAQWRRLAGIAAVLAPPILYAGLALSPLGSRVVGGLSTEARRTMLLPAGPRLPRAGPWARERLEALPEGAVLHVAWGDGEVFFYLQLIEGLRPDVLVVNDIERLPGKLHDVPDLRLHRVSLMPLWTDEFYGVPEKLRPMLRRTDVHGIYEIAR